MYSGELEVQAKRKILAILHDEIGKILNSARELSSLGKSITHGVTHDVQPTLDRMRIAEEDVDNLRRRVTREVAEIGSLMVYREDVLRTAYIMDDIAGYISGVAFRLANMKVDVIMIGRFANDINELIGMVVDDRHRSLIIKAMNEISVTKDLLLLKDAIEGIEGMADKCQEASDSLTILALSM